MPLKNFKCFSNNKPHTYYKIFYELYQGHICISERFGGGGGQEKELLLKVSSTCKVLITIVKIHTVVLWTSISLIITMALEANIANYPIKI
jgi:hypothetical protein